MVSIKQEPIAAQTVTATNAQLQLQTDKAASQSYGTHSGLGLNQSNLSDYLIDHRTANAQLLSNTSYSSRHSNVGKPLTREPLCKLPDFDGSSNLKKFRVAFTEFCQMNGYVSEQEITFWLKQCLKSPAKDILYDGCSDLNVIWWRLETRFESHLLFQKYSVSLPARKRQKNESLTKLADDIRNMSDIVYYDLQQDQN